MGGGAGRQWANAKGANIASGITQATSNKNRIWQHWRRAERVHTLLRQTPSRTHEQGQRLDRDGNRYRHRDVDWDGGGVGNGDRRPGTWDFGLHLNLYVAGHVVIKKTFMALCSNIKWI